jgi:hypothetical protein
MSLAAGTRLGPYEIVSALGAGGVGEVRERFRDAGELHPADFRSARSFLMIQKV